MDTVMNSPQTIDQKTTIQNPMPIPKINYSHDPSAYNIDNSTRTLYNINSFTYGNNSFLKFIETNHTPNAIVIKAPTVDPDYYYLYDNTTLDNIDKMIDQNISRMKQIDPIPDIELFDTETPNMNAQNTTVIKTFNNPVTNESINTKLIFTHHARIISLIFMPNSMKAYCKFCYYCNDQIVTTIFAFSGIIEHTGMFSLIAPDCMYTIVLYSNVTKTPGIIYGYYESEPEYVVKLCCANSKSNDLLKSGLIMGIGGESNTVFRFKKIDEFRIKP